MAYLWLFKWKSLSRILHPNEAMQKAAELACDRHGYELAGESLAITLKIGNM